MYTKNHILQEGMGCKFEALSDCIELQENPKYIKEEPTNS
jgi:hypothetical protein